MRLMIELGDTSPDSAVLAEGVEPRNVFLSDFFASGGREALEKLIRRKVTFDHVMRLYKLVVSIVGGGFKL